MLACGLVALPRAHACGATPDSWVLRTNVDATVFAGITELDLYVQGSLPEVSLRLFKLDAGESEPAEIALEVDKTGAVWVLQLAEAVEAGVEYVLKVELADATGGDLTVQEQTFSGVAPPPRPTRIELEVGAVVARAEPQGAVCDVGVVGVEAELGLLDSPELLAWQRASRHQLLVDGEPAFAQVIPQLNIVGAVQAPIVRVAADCGDASEGGKLLGAHGSLLVLEPSQHSVQWRLEFPDGSALLSEVQQVDLRCDTDVPSEPEAPAENDAVTTPTPKASGGGACSLTAVGREPDGRSLPAWGVSWLVGLMLGVRRLTRRRRA